MTAAGGITEDRVRELIVEAVAATLPVAVKLIEHQVEARFAASHGQRPLFHDWGARP